MIIAALVHIVVLPFADLTLLCTTNATGIIAGVSFGIFWLKEPFNVKVDLPALILMIIGTVSLALLSNKQAFYYSGPEMKELMLAPAAQLYYVVLGFLMIASIVSYKILMTRLRIFEDEVDKSI